MPDEDAFCARMVVALASRRCCDLPSAQSPELQKILAEIKAKDSGQLAVSEEDGRFLRLIVASKGGQARTRNRRRERLQRDLDRHGTA